MRLGSLIRRVIVERGGVWELGPISQSAARMRAQPPYPVTRSRNGQEIGIWPQLLQDFNATAFVEVKDVFTLESPPSTDFSHMRFKGEKRNVAKPLVVGSFDVLAIAAVGCDAMANVPKEVQVFKSAGLDAIVCPFVQLVELHFRTDDFLHRSM